MHRVLAVVAILGLSGGAVLGDATVPVTAPELSDETFDDLAAEILPDESECSFETAIPWRPAFGPAVEEARARDLPVLLWAMNGHPLACT